MEPAYNYCIYTGVLQDLSNVDHFRYYTEIYLMEQKYALKEGGQTYIFPSLQGQLILGWVMK